MYTLHLCFNSLLTESFGVIPYSSFLGSSFTINHLSCSKNSISGRSLLTKPHFPNPLQLPYFRLPSSLYLNHCSFSPIDLNGSSSNIYLNSPSQRILVSNISVIMAFHIFNKCNSVLYLAELSRTLIKSSLLCLCVLSWFMLVTDQMSSLSLLYSWILPSNNSEVNALSQHSQPPSITMRANSDFISAIISLVFKICQTFY